MGNTIQHTVRPIAYGALIPKNPTTEAAINFLEDPANKDKPLPPNIFMDYEFELINQMGREAYADKLREQLSGHPGG